MDLTEDSKINIDWVIQSYSYGSLSSVVQELIIYDQNNKRIDKARIYEKDPVKSVFYLEAGTYYLELHTDNGFTNGKSSIKVTTQALPNVTITPNTTKPTNKDVKFTIKKTISPSESVQVSVSDTDYGKDSSSWDYSSTLILKSTSANTFSISKNGTYYLCAKYAVDGKVVYTKITSFKVSNIDKVKPKTPTVNSVKANAVEVTGKGEKKASVIVTIGSKKYEGTVNASGKFSVKIPKTKKGQKISVKLNDAVGNTSSAKEVTVK